MPLTYTIDKQRRLVIGTAVGVFTFSEALYIQRRLGSDPDFDPTFSQLTDFSRVTNYQISASEIRILAQTNLFSPEARRALYITSDLGYGLARMFEAIRDAAGESNIRVFRDYDEAMDWVLAKTSSA